MRTLVFNTLLAVIFRALGTVLRANNQHLIVRSVGWVVSLSAVWIATTVVGATAGIWVIVPGIVMGIAAERALKQPPTLKQNLLISSGIDIITIALAGLLSNPGLGVGLVAGTIVVVAGLGLLLDWGYYKSVRLQYKVATIALFFVISPPALFLAHPYVLPTGIAILQERYDAARYAAVIEPVPTPASAAFNTTGTQWEPYLEWHLNNPTYEGNPYDLVASATFVHQESGETRTTEMFFDRNNTWKFRFTGTRPGQWTFTTQSNDPDLDGQQGQVTIEPNPDTNIKGFLTTAGNKFAIQTGEEGTLEAYRFNAYMNLENFNVFGTPILALYNTDTLNAYLQEAQAHGFDTIFLHPGYPDVWTDEVNPNPILFQVVEKAIVTAHSRGMRVHIWAWADAMRGGTPPGGLNSPEDKRLQRYTAARLGPLPGWTMGYGFDLLEWTTEADLQEWAEYLQSHFGWQHLLWGRNRFNKALDVNAHATIHGPPYPESIPTIIELMQTDPNRPHLYEERFSYGRFDKTMADSRRTLWHLTMAGGAGGFWGHYSRPIPTGYTPPPYPNPEQFKTAAQFWQNRFLLDMEPTNDIIDGWALKNKAADKLIFYKEATDTVQLNLTGMNGAQPAIAVDTAQDYSELHLGLLEPTEQTWTAPYASDWAIAVGSFDN